jgi:hypothetical protein
VNIEEAFPSKYLKAADLQGQSVVAKMATVRQEKVGDDQKIILYFVGKEKGVVLNKTNKNTIVGLYGTETDEWTGQPIEMFAALVDFQGKQTEAIRFRAPRLNGKPKTAPSAAHTDANPPPADEVDF